MPVLDEVSGAKKKHFDLVLEKTSQRRLTPERVREQLAYIRDAVSRNRQRRFSGHLAKKLPEPVSVVMAGQQSFVYTTKLRLVKEGETQTREKLQEQYEAVVRVVQAAGRTHGWRVASEDDQAMLLRSGDNPIIAEAKRTTDMSIRQKLDVELPELTSDNLCAFFSRIYKRENHIQIIHRANVTAAMTKFDKRRHSLCWGPPGCAKTELFDSFVQFYGPDKVLHLDSTTTTKAGLETLILNRARDGTLPPFLYLEEIEKYDLNAMHVLHAIMDQRGRVQRTNARIGNVAADAKLVVWATCNSLNKLKQFEGGAILSRFSNRKQLYCPRPDEELMRRILTREVTEMGGDEEWVEPVVRFVFDEMKTNDPREAVALLDGRELLLDGTYLTWVRENIEAERRDRETERVNEAAANGL